MAKGLGIEATVTFPGALFGEDKRAAFHYCDGFILPSLSEGLPMVLLEAWACGKPVLMTPQCNLPEGFDAGAAVRIEPTEGEHHRGAHEFHGNAGYGTRGPLARGGSRWLPSDSPGRSSRPKWPPFTAGWPGAGQGRRR